MGNIHEDTSCFHRARLSKFTPSGKLADFKKLCAQFIEKTKPEPGCLYYGFSFDGDLAFCREAYIDAEAALAHVQNVSPLLAEAAKISDIIRLEIHAPENEIAKLRGPAAGLKPQFFIVECGFRH